MKVRQYIRSNKELRIISNLGIVSILFIILIKGIIRPMHIHFSIVGTILQGVLPNFFAASGFSAFLFIQISFFLFTKSSRNVIPKSLLSALILPFLVLVSWEYIQFFIWQCPIDYLDILASALGSGLIIILISYLTKQLRKNGCLLCEE